MTSHRSRVPPRTACGYTGSMRVSRLLIAFLVVNWAFLALYPDPRVLWRSVDNLRHPNVDPAAVSALAARLPNDPNAIRDAVLTRIVPYAYDWQVNGVPWTSPPPRRRCEPGEGTARARPSCWRVSSRRRGSRSSLRWASTTSGCRSGQDGQRPRERRRRLRRAEARSLRVPLAGELQSREGGPRSGGDLLDAHASRTQARLLRRHRRPPLPQRAGGPGAARRRRRPVARRGAAGAAPSASAQGSAAHPRRRARA